VIQRISIVRVLALEPKIILFDEANTAIDSRGDALLKNYLAEVKSHCTIILISQRPSLLNISNRLYRLRDKRLLPMANIQEIFASESVTGTTTHLTFPSQHLGTSGFFSFTKEGEQHPSLYEQAPTWQQFIDNFPYPSPFSRCLRGLLEAMAWRGSGRQLAEAVPHLFGTMDLAGLCTTMANLNFKHRQEMGHIDEIDPRLIPFLFCTEKGEALVVLGKNEDGSVIAISGVDGQRSNRNNLGKGGAFFFQPPTVETQRIGSWIQHHLSSFYSLVLLTMVITIFGNIMATATPIFTMMVYDRIIPSGSWNMGLSLLVGVLLAIALDVVTRIQRIRILAFIGAKSERVLTQSILDRLLAMPASLTERVAVGTQVARIKSMEVMREMFTGVLAHLYYDAPTTIFFLIVLFVVNPEVIFSMLLLVAVLVAVGGVMMPIMRTRSAHAAKLLSQRQTFLTETFARIQVIYDTRATHTWYERYRDLSGKAALFAFRNNMITSILGILSHSITMAASVGVMMVTANHVMAGNISTGAVIASMMLTWRIFTPVQTTFLGISKMVQIINSMNSIDRLMEIKGEREMGALTPMPKHFKGRVTFHRVSFRYSSDAEPAMVGVSFDIPAGSVVSIIGANGSGKSTLIKMILGLYAPQAGSILIDNGDIRQTDANELRHAISYLPQTCDIFFGTIAQNLKLANPVATTEEMMLACYKAGILDEILNLPNGFQTRLQESRAEQLSAGFKQRLSLARVYLKQSPIILFDEPGNNLDSESERLFREAVNELRGKATMFIVTHRPSHMQLSDLVLYMDSGYLKAAVPPKDIGKYLPKGFV
ncbi:MAG: ATP-binding cassette domain-containing protein, partial [Magnetococcales bacterium]|nr:ATP-binding cassette domain-containing protein [Magnetococcales bacterium]